MAKAKSSFRWYHVLWLAPVPFLWVLIQHLGWLMQLEEITLDWRFKLRDPQTSNAFVYYVNRDELTTAVYGSHPFPRRLYGKVSDAVITLGGADAIFHDFILSPLGVTTLIPREVSIEDQAELARYIRRLHPRVILAAGYTGVFYRLTEEVSRLPLISRDSAGEGAYDPASNPYPETPLFPIWNPSVTDGFFQREGFGKVALINSETERTSGPVWRWMPLFVQTRSERHMEVFLKGYARWLEQNYPDLAGNMRLTSLPDDLDAFGGYLELQVNPDQLPGLPQESLILPRIVPHTFFTAAIETLASVLNIDSQKGISIEGDAVRIADAGGETVASIPLVDGQLLEINWYAPWLDDETETPDLSADKLKLALEVIDIERRLHNEPGAFVEERDRFIRAVEALTAFPSNPYSPKESMALVLALYDFYNAHDDDACRAVIKSWFERFSGAIVLCGPTDRVLQDIGPTPIDQGNVPRVTAHANLIKSIVDGKYIRRLPQEPWSASGITILLSVIVCMLAIPTGRYSAVAKGGAAGILIAYVAVAFAAFSWFTFVIPIAVPIGAALSTSMLGLGVQLVLQERVKKRITGMFGTYLSPKVVNKMVESGEEPQLGGISAEITAYFSDLQGFSSFSEILTPSQLVDLLNEYLTPMTDILMDEDCTLDKYIGDAIVGFFNAPTPIENHALRACIACCKMQNRLAELRTKWASEGDRWPEAVHRMQARMGCNTGLATVGNMGSPKRFNYTMMGDSVNLAARCESGAKSYGVYIMITGETRRSAEAAGDDCVFRLLDRIVVKGRSQPVEVHEVMGLREQTPSETFECLELFQRGLDAYFAQHWDQAVAHFSASENLEPNRPAKNPDAPTTPSTVFVKRCLEMKKNPPDANWDGVYIMKSK